MIKYVLILKDGVEQISYFISALTSTLFSLIKIPILSRLGLTLPLKTNSQVVVIGNGPSFTQAIGEHPNFFVNKDIICVNAFPSSDSFVKLKPSMLVWLDVGFYPKEQANLRPDLAALFDTIVKDTQWRLNILVPQLAKSADYIKNIERLNPNVKIYYFNYTIAKGFQWFEQMVFSAKLGMPLCQNVVVAASFLAVAMRYENVYLLGVENSFFKDISVDEYNDVTLNHHHFYDKEKQSHKIYKRPDTKQTIDVAGVLMMAVKTFIGYKKVAQYAQHQKVNIFNVSSNSYVDAFERRSLNDL